MKPTKPYCILIIFEIFLLIEFNACLQLENSSDSLIINFKENYKKLSKEFDMLINYSQNITQVIEDNSLSQVDHIPSKTEKNEEQSEISLKRSPENTLAISDLKLKELKKITDQVNTSIANLQNYHKTFIIDFQDFEDTLKKKNLKKVKNRYQKNVLFYNSISLVMLCLLSGGLVGVIFILYYSFSTKDGKTDET